MIIMFESSVISSGSKTVSVQPNDATEFESSVISSGNKRVRSLQRW